MTQLFQSLDFTENGAAKAIMKRKFTEWYNRYISAQLYDGRDVEDVEVPFKLSILKPFQAKWIINLFHYFTSEKG